MKRHILLGLAAVSIAAVACASDPNKKVSEAQDEQLKSERKAEEAAAEARKDYQTDEAKELRKETINAGVPGDLAAHKRLKADAKMTEQREVALAEVNERIDKLDARTNELRVRINKAPGRATTSSRDSIASVDQQHTAARLAIDRLASSTDADFKRARDDADYELDTLAAYVKSLGKEVDAFQ